MSFQSRRASSREIASCSCSLFFFGTMLSPRSEHATSSSTRFATVPMWLKENGNYVRLPGTFGYIKVENARHHPPEIVMKRRRASENVELAVGQERCIMKPHIQPQFAPEVRRNTTEVNPPIVIRVRPLSFARARNYVDCDHRAPISGSIPGLQRRSASSRFPRG